MTGEEKKQMQQDGVTLAANIHKLMEEHFTKYPFLREPHVTIRMARKYTGEQFPICAEVKFESELMEYVA